MGTFWKMVNQEDPHRQRYSGDMQDDTKVHPEFEVMIKYTFSLFKLYIKILIRILITTTFIIFII